MRGRSCEIRAVALLLCAIAGAVAAGIAGPLAAVPAAVIWWAGTRWMSEATVGWTLGVAAALHLALGVTGFHSNDVHRYLWEGAIQLEGIDPYATAPADPSLAPFRNERFVRVTHPELPSLYPPLAQATFVVAAALGADELVYRDGILLLNFGVAGLLLGWMRATGRPVGRAAFYAWSPLALISAAGGHVDVVMVAALLGFAWSWESGRYRVAGCMLGGAILAKTVAVLILPWALWRRPAVVAWTALPIVALGYSPYLFSGGIDGSLLTFARQFQFNAPTYSLLTLVLGAGAPLGAALLLAVWVGWLTIREDAPADAVAMAMIGLLLLAPVVHYWYLTWFLIVLPGVRSPTLRWGGLAWAASIAALAPTYLAIARGELLPASGPSLFAEALLPLCAVAFVVHRARYAAAVARGSQGSPLHAM